MTMKIGNDDPNDQNPQDPAAQAVDDVKNMNSEADYSSPVTDNIFNRGGFGSFTPDRPFGDKDTGKVTGTTDKPGAGTGTTRQEARQAEVDSTKKRFGFIGKRTS